MFTMATRDKPYLYPHLPVVGDAIVFRGLDGPCRATVTALKHVETHSTHSRWGVFVETANGPAYINDYRVQQIVAQAPPAAA